MKNITLKFDNLGRVIVDDVKILAMINGAFSGDISEIDGDNLECPHINQGCINTVCHDVHCANVMQCRC